MDRAPAIGAICVERSFDAVAIRQPNTRRVWINRCRALLVNQPRSD